MNILEHSNGVINVQYTSLTHLLSLEHIKNIHAYFMISMKNKRFSKHLIRSVLQYALSMNWKLEITVVDAPYFSALSWNDSEGSRSLESGHEKLNRIALETKEKVTRIVQSFEPSCFKILEWSSISDQCESWIKDEINKAFIQNQHVTELLEAQTQEATGLDRSDPEFRAKVDFLLNEFPTLIWMYYSSENSVVDVYPGKNAFFFNELEKGHLIDELPKITKLVQKSPPLIYANVSAISVSKPSS